MIFLGRGHLQLRFTLLFCLLLARVSAKDVIATVGTNVTLQCNYDAQYYGRLSACWGRGAIPNSGCANEVIKTDGTSVTSRLSGRYLFIGNLGGGDVSLTILQVEESDSGMYGCRVEIPGWFNDHKHQLTLTVVAVRPNPLKVETREVKERTVTVRWTPVYDGGRPITSYRIDLKNKQSSWDTAVITKVSDPALTQLTLVDLRPAKTYSLRMFATNSIGMSEASNVLTVTTKEAAPEGPPLDMKLQALTPHSIKVTWKPPRPDLRNGVLRSYSISYREYDPSGRQFKGWQHQSVPATRDLESITLGNLKPSTKYGVLVQAKTNAGIGPASTAPLCSTLDEIHKTTTASTSKSSSTAATRWMQDTTSPPSTTESVTSAAIWRIHTSSITSVPPDPPVVELKEVRGNTISLLWTPGFEGDSPITGFYLEYKAVNASWDYTKTVVDFSPNQTEATIIEINPSTYNIRMFAKNSLGTSKASNVLTITTGQTAGHQTDDLVTTISTDTHAAEKQRKHQRLPDKFREKILEQIKKHYEDTAFSRLIKLASVEESQSGHLAAIVVPVVLVVLIAAVLTTWQLRRITKKKGSLSVWLSGGALRYSGSESLQEL